MQPAEARNYFSASYFSRDILIPSFFSSVLATEVFIFYPSLVETAKDELGQASLFLFLVSVYLFFAISITMTNLMHRAFVVFNKSTFSRIIPYTDYQIYYDARKDEINNILSETVKLSGSSMDVGSVDFNTLHVREQLNILLRVAERVFPEGSLMLSRFYGFVAITSALVMSQMVFLFVLLVYCSWANAAYCFGIFAFLLLALVGLVQAAAKAEFDVLRAYLLLLRMEKR